MLVDEELRLRGVEVLGEPSTQRRPGLHAPVEHGAEAVGADTDRFGNLALSESSGYEDRLGWLGNWHRASLLQLPPISGAGSGLR